MTSLQESQTQLQHTQGALTEQHEKALRLSQKVTALRCLHRRVSKEAHGNSETLIELDKDEKETEDEGNTEEDLNKSQVFSYQTPGLEILQYKYHGAVTEVVELKAEVKVLREKLAQCGEGAAQERPRRNSQFKKLEQLVASLERSCHEGQEKVTLSH